METFKFRFGLMSKDIKWLYLWPLGCTIILALSKSLQLELTLQVVQRSLRSAGYQWPITMLPFYAEVCAGGNPDKGAPGLLCHGDMLTLLQSESPHGVCLPKFWKNFLSRTWKSTMLSTYPAHQVLLYQVSYSSDKRNKRNWFNLKIYK